MPRSSRSRGTPTGVTSASFSPDGSRIVTASWDKTAKVWDSAPFKESDRTIAIRLPAVLKGEDRPADNAERLAFAQMAYDSKHFTAATTEARSIEER